MSYYSDRKRALSDIDALIGDGTPVAHIVYKISLKYGFGAKIVNERVKLIDEIKGETA